MKDKGEKALHGMRHKIREERKREERRGLAFAAIILIVVLVSSFFIHAMWPSSTQEKDPVSTSKSDPTFSNYKLKASIIDQLSLTVPNQSFVETATGILNDAGYTVHYYPGENVTVQFYRNLPTHGFSLVILRAHSTATMAEGTLTPLAIFTSELANQSKYPYEAMNEQLIRVSFSQQELDDGIIYYGITPSFVSQRMNGYFAKTAFIVMGCDGMFNTKMAESFVERGVGVYMSWSGPVLASHTDAATINALRHLVAEKHKIRTALRKTLDEIGPDPRSGSWLTFYPSAVGEEVLQNIFVN